jgi:hypothetical protein
MLPSFASTARYKLDESGRLVSVVDADSGVCTLCFPDFRN